MNIKNLIGQLDHRLKVMREYSNEEDYSLPWDDLKRYADHLKKDKNCLGHNPIIDDKKYRASDVCLLGPGSQKELGEEWHLPLPSDYLEFCTRFDDYLFAGSSYLVISGAEDVKDSVISARQAVDIDPSCRHRLFNFAEIMGIPGYFSFRWSEDDSRMDIVFVWDYGDITVRELLGKDGDRFVSDSDFTSWLSRMIEADGNPLLPGGRWPMADGGWYDDNYPYFERLS